MDEREAALAESPAISGTLVAQSVTAAQLRKLQELRQKRLQLKKAGSVSATAAKPKKQRLKKTVKLEGNSMASSDLSLAQNPQGLKELRSAETMPAQSQPKKRQKLYWGLDTKERWERKGNM